MGKERSTRAPSHISQSGYGLDSVRERFQFGFGSCYHLCGVSRFLPLASMELADLGSMLSPQLPHLGCRRGLTQSLLPWGYRW